MSCGKSVVGRKKKKWVVNLVINFLWMPNQTSQNQDTLVARYWERRLLVRFERVLLEPWHCCSFFFKNVSELLEHCECCVSAVVAIRDQPCRSMCLMSICTILHLGICAFVQLCICALMCLPICTFVLVWYVCFCWSTQVHIFDKVETPVTLLPQTTCGANESDGDSGDVHCPWQWWPWWWW